jgi:hypothetical protein
MAGIAWLCVSSVIETLAATSASVLKLSVIASHPNGEADQQSAES